MLIGQSEATHSAREIEKLKLTIARLRHEQYGQSSERRELLDQLELQLGELEENQAQVGCGSRDRRRRHEGGGAVVRRAASRRAGRCPSTCRASAWSTRRRRPARAAAGVLHKLGEDVSETLELVPRQWKVVCHVREKYSCRSCEAITQPPAPSHPIARGRAGPGLLAHVLFSKYGLHLPLQPSEPDLCPRGHRARRVDAGRLGGRSAATLMPLVEAIRAHVFGGRAAPRRRHAGAGARHRPDAHRAAMDLCARRPAVRRACARRRRSTSTRPIAAARIPKRIWPAGPD